jgi:hypothetical protein
MCEEAEGKEHHLEPLREVVNELSSQNTPPARATAEARGPITTNMLANVLEQMPSEVAPDFAVLERISRLPQVINLFNGPNYDPL